MAQQMLVREANPEDLDRVIELWVGLLDFHRAFDPKYRRCEGAEEGFAEYLRGVLEAPDSFLLVAEVDGTVEGFTNGTLAKYPPCLEHRDHGYLDNMVIAPEHRRDGLGTALMESALAWFRAQGAPVVESRVHLSNEVVDGFWKKAGFEPYMTMIRKKIEATE